MSDKNAVLSYDEFCLKLWLEYRGRECWLVFGEPRPRDEEQIRVNVSHTVNVSGKHHFTAPAYESARRMIYAMYLMEHLDSPREKSPDWNKIGELARKMGELVDEIEKEINDDRRNEGD